MLKMEKKKNLKMYLVFKLGNAQPSLSFFLCKNH